MSTPEEKIVQDHSQTPPPVLDTGLRAWSQVIGSFFLWFSTWGLFNSFGVFQTYYESNLLSHKSPSQISWIGSLQAFLLLFVGVLSGPAYDAGYFNTLLGLGTFLVVFGLMMTSLCTEYWQLMLAQGLVIGLGAGFLFVPAVAIMPQYFLKRRVLAGSLAASGAGVGGLVFPIIFRELQPRIGFGWAVRVLGFFALVSGSVSLALMRNRVKPSKIRKLFDVRALQEPAFGAFSCGMFMGFIGLYTPIFYIQSYAIQEHITDVNLGFYMLSILNAGSIFGRIAPGFVADKIGTLNTLVPCVLAVGVLGFGWIAIHNTAGLVVFAVLYGFLSGVFVSIPPSAVVALSPNLSLVGTRMGTNFAIAALGVLVGTPVSGEILNKSHAFVGLQAFGGATVLVAFVCFLVARLCKTGLHLRVRA